MNSIKMILLAALAIFTISGYADVHVNGYTKQDGTYVEPHYRSNPDGNVNNNWSTKGNTNPYTGEKGTQNPNNSDTYQNGY